LIILDISDIENPVELGTFDTNSDARDVDVVDNISYIADFNDGLLIVDVNDPENCELLGSFDTNGLAHSVKANGHYAYVCDGGNGFLSINVSDQAEPELVAHFDTPGTAYGVDFNDENIYIADANFGVEVIALTPEMVVSDEELDFGEVEVGENEEIILCISNDGHTDLIISEIIFEGRYFIFDFEEEATIGVREEYELLLVFEPEWFGVCEGVMTIISSDFHNNEIRVDLLGFGNLDLRKKK